METTKLLLDVREAAHLLSISPWTIRRYIYSGRLRSVRLGRRVLIEPSECLRLLEEGRNNIPERVATNCHNAADGEPSICGEKHSQ
jgi:excisionase family DNA binding protein